MRQFRLRVMAAVVMAILVLGLLGSVAEARGLSAQCFPEDPWDLAGIVNSGFPEDPWPGL